MTEQIRGYPMKNFFLSSDVFHPDIPMFPNVILYKATSDVRLHNTSMKLLSVAFKVLNTPFNYIFSAAFRSCNKTPSMIFQILLVNAHSKNKWLLLSPYSPTRGVYL